ncbi:MAG: 2'-deoxycytidine 5'-triphosphate deaminase [Parvibaculaceae bacterium]
MDDLDEKPPGKVVQLRDRGILPAQELRDMIQGLEIAPSSPALPAILEDQIQPASLDLRLGRFAHCVRASFLPGPERTVMSRVEALRQGPPIDLSSPEGAVLERNKVYVVEVIERVGLKGTVEGRANPKSSTGRLDVLTRVIADRATAFDQIEKRYLGPLYVEIAPLTFNIRVRQGSRLVQVRFQRGESDLGPKKLKEYYATGQLVGDGGQDQERFPPWNDLVPVTVDLAGGGNGIVGYRARDTAREIDVDRVGHYDPREFWEKLDASGGALELEAGRFYILATREHVGVPPELAAEMIPYEATSGEYRVHYAGFFDPGFGWVNGKARGSRAVLEVRAHGVPFILEDGQIIGWLRYSPIATSRPTKLYGHDIKSNYQGQGVALAKHFKPWPG